MNVLDWRCRPFLVGLILTIIPIAPAAADGPAGADSRSLQPQVDRLLKQLDAQTRRERAAAERELLGLGPVILPLLPPPDLLPSVSVRGAVRRIRIVLERRKSRESVLASRVTINKRLPLAELLQVISRQTGNEIDVAALPGKLRQTSVTADYKQRPFWPVVDELASRFGLQYGEGRRSGRLYLTVSPKNETPVEVAVAHSGAYRIAIQSASLRPLTNNAAHRKLRVYMSVMAEPRLRGLFLKIGGRDVAVRSPTKQNLEPLSPDASLELSLGDGRRQLKLHRDFLVPAALSLPHVALTGKVTMQTAAGTEKLTFRDLPDAEGVERRRGGVTVKLRRVTFRKPTASGHQLTLRVSVNYDTGGPAFESHRTWVFHNEVYLKTKAGRRLEVNGGFEVVMQSDGGVVVDYRFQGLKELPADYSFVYEAPTLIINVPIEFEFGKIPVSPTR